MNTSSRTIKRIINNGVTFATPRIHYTSLHEGTCAACTRMASVAAPCKADPTLHCIQIYSASGMRDPITATLVSAVRSTCYDLSDRHGAHVLWPSDAAPRPQCESVINNSAIDSRTVWFHRNTTSANHCPRPSSVSIAQVIECTACEASASVLPDLTTIHQRMPTIWRAMRILVYSATHCNRRAVTHLRY